MRPVPITAGERGWPFGAPAVDLDRFGYRQDEYFVDGAANRFVLAPGTTLTRDGRWSVEPAGVATFRTRLLVLRPVDATRFNGTVLLSWNNVTRGRDCPARIESASLMMSGFAYVGATAQRGGIHGLPGTRSGLVSWDADRYGSLSIPSDDFSFDVFSQLAAAVGRSRDRSADPLDGLAVHRVIAFGTSQSAARLATYVNAVHPIARAVDGFLLGLYFGNGSPLEIGDTVMDPRDRARSTRRGGTHLLRDDIDEPVMVVNSELEAIACLAIRQPDSDRFRWWEVAGTTHLDGCVAGRWLERDLGRQRRGRSDENQLSMAPVLDAALHGMHEWLAHGSAPEVQDRLVFTGDPPALVRDRQGIVSGGIRLPEVAVPVESNSSQPRSPEHGDALNGSCRPFSPAQLQALYGDDATYVARFEAAAGRAVEAGVLMEIDAEHARERARRRLPLIA